MSCIIDDDEVLELDLSLPQEFQDELEHILISNEDIPHDERVKYVLDLGTYVPNPNVVDNNIRDHHQLVSMFYDGDKNFNKLLKPLEVLQINLPNTQITHVERIKVNVVSSMRDYPNTDYSGPHEDEAEDDYYSLLYYVNDSDGDTIFFEEDIMDGVPNNFTISKKITPKKGNAVLFKSTKYHTGQPPREYPLRCVINYIIKLEDKPNAKKLGE